MSSATFYKAVRPDGGSFHNPAFEWATAAGGITTHPLGVTSLRRIDAGGYLSVSTIPTDCTGMSWPCRLLMVEPVGETWTPHAAKLPSKQAGFAFRTVRELPATDALGPQGVEVAAMINRALSLNPVEVERLVAARSAVRDAVFDAARYAMRDAARYAMRYAAWDAARHAMRDAARYAMRDAAWYAVMDAVRALVSRDLIGEQRFSQQHYDALTMPWRLVIGPIHPDDKQVK